ncbi:sialomucin core protein 24-like [Symsagittifera roscoffensis]|uniref:sialomucin core protein 24-like n=1 Tax=Symsagittifera roscoffensis TaxID=84072 RepID=UPI00307C96A9
MNLQLVVFLQLSLACMVILGTTTVQESENQFNATSNNCTTHTTCNDCLKTAGCAFFSCKLPGDDKKCNQNVTVEQLCNGNASAPIEYTQKCLSGNETEVGENKNDNPVDELGDDGGKEVDQKQQPKYRATQHFDLASFVGGIALSVCLSGIIFIIYKLWQSKNQVNYASVDGKSQY